MSFTFKFEFWKFARYWNFHSICRQTPVKCEICFQRYPYKEISPTYDPTTDLLGLMNCLSSTKKKRNMSCKHERKVFLMLLQLTSWSWWRVDLHSKVWEKTSRNTRNRKITTVITLFITTVISMVILRFRSYKNT